MECKAVDVEIQGEEEWEKLKYYVISRTTGRPDQDRGGGLVKLY